MKVKISYSIRVEKEVEMTPWEYCFNRANMSDLQNYPYDSFNKDIEIVNQESENELNKYFRSQRDWTPKEKEESMKRQREWDKRIESENEKVKQERIKQDLIESKKRLKMIKLGIKEYHDPHH